MFEKEIEDYERIRQRYQQKIADRMGKEQWMEYNEILFSAHSFELHKKNRLFCVLVNPQKQYLCHMNQ